MFTITATDVLGCTASQNLSLEVLKPRNVYIPNAFTPNDDGQNDTFRPYFGLGVKKLSLMRVFDRWGVEVFTLIDVPANDISLYGWNGSLNGQSYNPGVFVYFMDIEYLDGNKDFFKGDVTLIR
jgi:gliding motility-associated-like protein